MVKIYGVPEYAEGMNYIVCRETGYKEPPLPLAEWSSTIFKSRKALFFCAI